MIKNEKKQRCHIKTIFSEIRNRKQGGKVFIIGITGIDASGKTKFSEELEEFLVSKNYKTQVINLDDFHNPQKIRYFGDDQADNYYNKSFDTKTVVEKLLIPIKQKNAFTKKLSLLNLSTDNYENEKEYIFYKDSIVIFEGVFLFRKEFFSYIDYKIFIKISFKESVRRAKMRDVPLYGKKVLKKYNEKYLPAQKKYLDQFPPSETANIIINNTNWKFPEIKIIN